MRLWHQFGRLPAVPIVAAMYAIAITAGLLFEHAVALPIGLGLLAAFAAYCIATPAKGRDIFLISAAPSAVSGIVEEIAGVSRWWIAVPLIPVALLMIAREDRAPVRAEDEGESFVGSSSTS
jgi:hypothetical protein